MHTLNFGLPVRVSFRFRAGPAVAMALLLGVSGTSGCADDPVEAVPSDLAILTGAVPAPSTSDLEWAVAIDSASLAVQRIELTVGGAQHASLLERIHAVLMPTAWAHPGHAADGEVAGELVGPLVLTWPSETLVGNADGLPGEYQGVNLVFGNLEADTEGLAAGTMGRIAGEATQGAVSIPFEVVLSAVAESAVSGIAASFELPGTASINIAMSLTSDASTATMFDAIDFATLPVEDGVARIEPGTPEHNRIMRALNNHTYWRVTATPAP